MEPWQDVERNYQKQLIRAILLLQESVSLRNEVQYSQVVIGMNVSDENDSQTQQNFINRFRSVMIEHLVVRPLTTVEHH